MLKDVQRRGKGAIPVEKKDLLVIKGHGYTECSGLPELAERERATTEEFMPRFLTLRLASD